MKKFIVLIALMLIGTVALSGCMGKEPTKMGEQAGDKQSDMSDKEKPTKTFPLTGLPAKGEKINRRVVGVMINNHSRARPQSGLHKADVVFEALAEGNITRFIALFQSQTPSTIGPVRSARPYFIELLQGYNGIYVSHGWSPQAKDMLQGGDTPYVQGLYHDGTLFHRASFREAPHNSYISYENIIKGSKDKGYKVTDDVKPLPFLTEEEAAAISGQTIKGVRITYGDRNVPGYVYDKKKGIFVRHINGETAHDRETDEPLTAANILIISAEHWFIDDYPRRAIDLKSGGPAYLLQKGKLQKVEWRNVNGRILPYENGKKLKLVPGKTWVNIIPSDRGLKQMVTIVKKES